MNKLQQILIDNTPEYEYRIKFACEPTKEDLSKIHARLRDRYDATEIGPLLKSIFQDRPLDFYNLDCGEIWWMDFKCTRGLQPEVLLYEIGNMLKWSEALLRVRGKNEPVEIEQDSCDDSDLELDEYDPVLGVPFGEEEPDGQELAGQERAEDAVQDALVKLGAKKANYAEFMSAGFGKKE